MPETVYVDREMWEKVVLNLLSNAYKYTLTGSISIALRREGREAILSVADTGTGIPEAELPRLFERFHRIEGARGRTQEGTGIGLALVKELVHLQGGQVSVVSRWNEGSVFTVSVPFGASHLPTDQIREPGLDRSSPRLALQFVEEAARWLPDEPADFSGLSKVLGHGAEPSPGASLDRPRVLVADDNADMREYVARLLSPRYEVVAVADGLSAIAAIRSGRPDLVVSDVMMPGLDGFGLLQTLRSTAETVNLPVILLSARAGEEARVEGLEAGADDYLIKPFTARELLASVRSNLELARLRREAEIAVRQSEERFRTAFANAAFGQAMTDLEGRFLEVNPAFETITGLSRDALARTDIEALTHPDDRARAKELRGQMIAGAIPGYVIEKRYLGGEGSIVWVKDSVSLVRVKGGDPLRIVVLSEDVTDRKRAEEALRDARARLDAALAAGAIATWTWDIPNDRVFADHNLASMFSVSAEDASGGPLGSYLKSIHPDDRANAVQSLRQAIESGVDYAADFRVVRPDGSIRWIAARGSVKPGEAGSVEWMPGVVVDITDRKRIEEELRDAKNEAERANRAKTQFLAILSHELRTPLNPILLASSALLERDGEPDQIRPTLEMIRQNVNLQARLIDDLLDVMRIVQGKMPLHSEVVDCHQLVEHAVEICRSEVFGKQLQLALDLEADQRHVEADPARLQQVFWNLIKNAVKFTPSGGRITIRTFNSAGSDNETHPRIGIEVIDTGIGIDPEVLPNIFDPFQQGETTITRQFGGLGLGLAICWGIIEAHDGKMVAESLGKGRGTTMRVWLPSAAAPAIAYHDNGQPVSSPPQPLPRSLKLLLVEDEPTTLMLMARLLRGLGHEVTTAESIGQAFEAIDAEDFGLIISDIGLPDGSGLDFMKKAVARRGPRPAIALTGFGMEDDIKRSRDAGFTAHLTKPIDFSKLEAMIRQVAPTSA